MSPAQAARLLRDEVRWLEGSRERLRAARTAVPVAATSSAAATAAGGTGSTTGETR